jgi:carbonic anhydrase/acetyltransferase-like protein (isoleucine patch superfamily)
LIAGMATVATSVSLIAGPLPNAAELDARVQAIRALFPRAIVDRYLDRVPVVGQGVLVAPGAAIVGGVELHEDVSIWYGAVLRADIAAIVIGPRANVQDGTVIHVADDTPCVIGADTVVGHRAMLHACRVEEACLIGMQATILDDAIIGQGSIVGAGALITQGMVVPPRSLVLGAPARVVRKLTESDEQFHRDVAAKYVRVKENYRRDALR